MHHSRHTRTPKPQRSDTAALRPSRSPTLGRSGEVLRLLTRPYGKSPGNYWCAADVDACWLARITEFTAHRPEHAAYPALPTWKGRTRCVTTVGTPWLRSSRNPRSTIQPVPAPAAAPADRPGVAKNPPDGRGRHRQRGWMRKFNGGRADREAIIAALLRVSSGTAP